MRAKGLDALSMKSGAQLGPDDSVSRVGANDKNQEPEKQEDKAPIQEQQKEEDAEDDQAELYDEINSLYNMENPKGDDSDEKRSQIS